VLFISQKIKIDWVKITHFGHCNYRHQAPTTNHQAPTTKPPEMSREQVGSIHLIIGPMYAGKTTEMLRLKRRAELAGKRCLTIKYHLDTRYETKSDGEDKSVIITHDKVTDYAHRSCGDNLSETISHIDDVHQYDCIYIDEIQFYSDGASVCDQLANSGIEVVASGLQGDYQRKIFKTISELIPMSDRITHLTAIDGRTGQEASFTARIVSNDGQKLIGGPESYIATDRAHYNLLHQKQQ